LSIDIRRTYAEKMLGLYRPNERLILERNCEVETTLDVMNLTAKESLIIRGKLLRVRWNVEVAGDLIMEAEGALVEAENGHVKIGGLLQADKINANKFIEANSIDAKHIKSGQGYSIITNSIEGEPKVRGRVIKRDP
jgi:hypothetical protein